MKKQISFLGWVEDLLPEGFIRKPMFGGYAYYVGPLLVLVLFESPGDRVYKNKIVDFDLWNGCMFPAEKHKHEKIRALFPNLIVHPILGKWLYLPQQAEDFETQVAQIIKQLRRNLDLFGTIPKQKKMKSTSPQLKGPIDTRRPTLFSDTLARTKKSTKDKPKSCAHVQRPKNKA